MRRIGTIAALTLLAGPALAAGETPFETVAGWEIERSAGGSTCLMSKSYKDADDDNAENALVVALVGDKVVMAFAYEHWTWGKDEKLRVPLVLDTRVAIPKSAWTGNGRNLRAELPDTLVPNLLAAKTMILKLDGADADFNLAGFPQAYESLRRCDNTPKAAAAAPAAAATAVPASAPSAHIVRAMTFPGNGDVPPQTVFARSTPKILLALEVRAAKPGDKLTATWFAEKTSVATPNLQIGSLELALETSPLVSFSLSKPDAGWPPGLYRVDVSHNGGPSEFSQRFTVSE